MANINLRRKRSTTKEATKKIDLISSSTRAINYAKKNYDLEDYFELSTLQNIRFNLLQYCQQPYLTNEEYKDGFDTLLKVEKGMTKLIDEMEDEDDDYI